MADTFHKKAIIIGLTFVAIGILSVAYYYVIALPKHNAARLRFDQEKHAEERRQRERREFHDTLDQSKKQSEKDLKKTLLDICLGYADKESNSYVLLNGGEKKANGVVEAPRYVWDEAAKKTKALKDECYREYNLP